MSLHKQRKTVVVQRGKLLKSTAVSRIGLVIHRIQKLCWENASGEATTSEGFARETRCQVYTFTEMPAREYGVHGGTMGTFKVTELRKSWMISGPGQALP
jgi:hypothetical protein